MEVADALGTAHSDGLEVLAAHHRANTRAASSAVQVIDHSGKQHAVFTGFANTGHTRQWVLQTLFDDLFGFPDALAPQVAGITQLGHVIIDVQVHRLVGLAFKNDHVPAGHFELGTPVTA
ncbi:hypothetical protein GALL_419780 [mine drainage metagenome]|uniref:Uncharacterized protein n=1 Tax=mine drainage metagenome TaxID=410659 RepID=A0A1J5PXX0_9ZZZZ